MGFQRAIHRASARLLAYACVIVLAAPAYAVDRDVDRSKVVRISGPISTQALTKLGLALNGFDNADPIPAGLIILLNSPGGDGEIAMQMGRLLRKHHAHIFVTQQCDSACAFLLMGGVVRAASPGTVGVHAGRLTVMTGDGNIVKEVDANRSLDHSFQLASYNRDTRLYLQEMGIDHRILDVMLAHRTPQVYPLSSEEMRQYQLTGFDNAYLNQRIQLLEAQQETHQINRVSLFGRTMSVPIRCSGAAPSDRRFVDCYQETLLAK
jgi:hypothetical protein